MQSFVRSRWRLASGKECLSLAELSITWRVAWHGLPLNYKLCHISATQISPYCFRCDMREKETEAHAFLLCPKIQPLIAYVEETIAYMDPHQRHVLDAPYVIDNAAPPGPKSKRTLFWQILAVARLLIWTTRLNELFLESSFTARSLILCFRYRLEMKIRCDFVRLSKEEFIDKWTNVASLVVWRDAEWEVMLPPVNPL